MNPVYSIKDKILELEKRKEIYNIVKKYSGSHFREIERKSRIPATSLRYHLHYLRKHGLISEEKSGNNLRYFSMEHNVEDKKLLSLLRQKNIRKILIYILTNKICTFEEIVKSVGLSPSTISWYLKKLEDQNVIVKKRGPKTTYSLNINEKEIINLLMSYKESFLDTLVDRVIEMWDVS